MKTQDEIAKIKAVLLYILSKFPTGIDFIKLFKIMYFAQQEHLVKYGRGVMDDTFYALKHGPVPSFTYKAIQVNQGKIKKSSSDLDEIVLSIVINNNKMSANTAADMDELSLSDVKCIDNAINKYKDADSYALSDLSHDDAWKEAYKRAQDDPEKNKMTLIDIAKAGKAKRDVINLIREHEIMKRALDC
ncbi:MAG: SocA family protein [Tannerellaceae bacterium]|jgi:uncharacterized phage-associated protein|nr:SocA family protein [Tannerellaceae bacterium]